MNEVAPGAIYIGPGSGIVSYGDSAKAVMDKLEQRITLLKLKYQLINNTKQFISPVFEYLDFIINLDIKFKLEMKHNSYLLNELKVGFQVYINR